MQSHFSMLAVQADWLIASSAGRPTRNPAQRNLKINFLRTGSVLRPQEFYSGGPLCTLWGQKMT